jgi:hypothetical protein
VIETATDCDGVVGPAVCPEQPKQNGANIDATASPRSQR